jgi:hypothetical protein
MAWRAQALGLLVAEFGLHLAEAHIFPACFSRIEAELKKVASPCHVEGAGGPFVFFVFFVA